MTKALRTVVRGDARLAVTDWGGTGPTMVIVHGLGGDQRDVETLATVLSEQCRVVTYDQRCHGRSSGSHNRSWPAFVGDLEAVLADLDLHDVTLVGHSFGAGVTLEVAVGNSDCRALALVDGGFPVPEPPPGRKPSRMLLRSLKMRAKWAALRPLHRVHAFSSSTLRAVGDDYRSRFAEFDAALQALACPTVFFFGAVTEYGPDGPAVQVARQQAAARAVEANPDVDVQWIDGRHDMMQTHPQEIATSLLRLQALD